MPSSALSGPSQAPASGGPAKQLIIFLHGVGADGNDLISLAPLMAEFFPDAHFVSPNAPFPCDMAPFGYQWFSLQDRNPEVLLEGVRKAEPILNDFINEQLEKVNLSDDKLALVGFSQGTMTALHTALRRPNACACILGYSGALLMPGILPDEIKSRPPVCLVHGEADEVVPFVALDEAQRGLMNAGVEVEAHSNPELGHGIDPGGLKIGVDFLKKHLG